MSVPTTLLAFDFDGTLAPICDDPASARLSRGAGELLDEVCRLPAVVVAVVSGRDATDLVQRVGVRDAYLVASHGLEIRAPGGDTVRDAPALGAELPAELLRAIERGGGMPPRSEEETAKDAGRARATRRLRLEQKKHAIALHWRGSPYEAVEPVAGMFRAWAGREKLEVIEGRCVVEARCRGARKEEAVRWLMRSTGARRLVYAGDDVTDFGALKIAVARGRAIFMASGERAAPCGATVVGSFRELFRIVRQEARI